MIEAWFDGCCEPVNPGGTAGYGALVRIDGEVVWEGSGTYKPKRLGETSNNLAEYEGLISALRYLIDAGKTNQDTIIRGDSKMVIMQMRGEWRINPAKIYTDQAIIARALLQKFSSPPRFEWIPREQNSEADELSKAHLKTAGIEFRIQRE